MFTAVVTGGVLIGLFSGACLYHGHGFHYDEISMPLEVFANSFSGWMVFAAFIAAIIPAIFIMYAWVLP